MTAPPQNGATPLLDKPGADEDELWRALRRGDNAAREQLFSMHFSFAIGIAKKHYFRWTGSDLELNDLRQGACAGLLEAIDHFNPSLGTPFTAYARRRIRGSVLDVANKASEVREQVAARAKIRQERLRSLRESKPASNANPLQELMELAVGLALGFMLEGSNLYVANESADAAASAYDSLAWRELTQRLHEHLSKLAPREQAVLRHHYSGDLNFERIGALMGVSRSRISQIHHDAIARLRSSLTQPKSFNFET